MLMTTRICLAFLGMIGMIPQQEMQGAETPELCVARLNVGVCFFYFDHTLYMAL